MSLKEGGIIREGWNAEIDELRTPSHDSKSTIEKMEEGERAREVLSNLETNELDPLGRPRLARSRRTIDDRQPLLFEPTAPPPAILHLQEELHSIKIDETTTLEALNRLQTMKKKADATHNHDALP